MNKKHIETMACSLNIALKMTSKQVKRVTKQRTKNHIILNRTECLKFFFFEYVTGFIKAVEVIQPRAGSIFLL